jgi:hypothetical protein
MARPAAAAGLATFDGDRVLEAWFPQPALAADPETVALPERDAGGRRRIEVGSPTSTRAPPTPPTPICACTCSPTAWPPRTRSGSTDLRRAGQRRVDRPRAARPRAGQPERVRTGEPVRVAAVDKFRA